MSVALYTYWRSSAAYRVRIALAVKGITYDAIPIHLTREGGQHKRPDYRAVNPIGLVPTLRLAGGQLLTQSLAIIEYLDETVPLPRLLPTDPLARARVRAAAQVIACDIHPINNLRVVQHLRTKYGRDQDDVGDWMRHWMGDGLAAYAAMIERDSAFSFGDEPTLADLCLVPQMYNARRWALDLSELQSLVAIEARCLALPAFARSAPEAQPDAENP